MLLKIKKNKAGFTLVESMMFILIFSIVAISFYRTMAGGLVVLKDSKARIAASEVANERIEMLRNLAYENIGTVGGDPVGLIERQQILVRSGIRFAVDTEVRYSDDEYDNVSNDDMPNDYKQIEVDVSWGNVGANNKVSLVSHIAPPGTEELYNGGILNIQVLNSNAELVENANVKVKNMSTAAEIYNSSTTSGKLHFIGLAPAPYEITTSKGDYNSAVTMPYDETSAYLPAKIHPNVTAAGIVNVTLTIDQLANLQLKTQDPNGNDIPNIDFYLEGGQLLGTIGSAKVFSNAKALHTTGSDGIFTLNDTSPGEFIFSWPNPVTANNTDYEFWKVQPMYASKHEKFFVDPDTTTGILALLVPKNTPSLFLTITDQAIAQTPPLPPIPGNPISEARVTVRNEALSYDSGEILTDKLGKVYFPNSETPLQNGEDYVVTIEAAGYQTKVETITVLDLKSVSLEIVPE